MPIGKYLELNPSSEGCVTLPADVEWLAEVQVYLGSLAREI